MPASCDLFQRLRDAGIGSSRGNRRGGAHVHEIDHRDRCVRFGKRRGHGCEGAWSESRAADLGGQHNSEQSCPTESLDSFG